MVDIMKDYMKKDWNYSLWCECLCRNPYKDKS